MWHLVLCPKTDIEGWFHPQPKSRLGAVTPSAQGRTNEASEHERAGKWAAAWKRCVAWLGNRKHHFRSLPRFRVFHVAGHFRPL